MYKRQVVDKRLLTGKPMIVTTNIPLSVMKQAVDLDDRRIYDRILSLIHISKPTACAGSYGANGESALKSAPRQPDLSYWQETQGYLSLIHI